MRITKFEAGSSFSDGAFYANFEWSAVNPTDQDVRMIRYDAVITDVDGYALAYNVGNEINCNIEANGEETTSSWAMLDSRFAGNEAGRLKLTMSYTLYSREYHKIGEAGLPSDEVPLARLAREVSSVLIDGTLRANVLRDAVGSDGCTGISALILVKSKYEACLPRVELKCDLLDADGGHIETESSSTGLNPHAVSCIQCGLWRLKRAQLPGARIRVGLYVYRPIHSATCVASNVSVNERICEDE
jgi:hypothetical protein